MTPEIQELIEKNRFIRLDIGCGASKQDGFVGIDVQALPGVDIVHNLGLFPWPLPDGCVDVAVASHLVEHISPGYTDSRLTELIKLLIKNEVLGLKEVEEAIGDFSSFPTFIRFMDEVWRVLRPGGQFLMVFPYGTSYGYVQDPTHVNQINETTFHYFDPESPTGFYRFYQPKPWEIKDNVWNVIGNMEVKLVKRELP